MCRRARQQDGKTVYDSVQHENSDGAECTAAVHIIITGLTQSAAFQSIEQNGTHFDYECTIFIIITLFFARENIQWLNLC